MKVPNSELHYSHIAAYGSGGIELDPGVAEPGCPDLFHARYVAKSRIKRIQSPLLTYGSVIHKALYLIEEETVSQDEALERAWDDTLSLDRFEEAQRDLRRVVERGGIAGGLNTVAVEQHLSCDLLDGYRYGGTLDVIAVDSTLGDEPIPTLFFTDWKTDRGTPSRKDVEEWKQGRGYAMLLYDNFQKYVPWADDVNIVGIYDAIKRYPIAMPYSKEQIESFRAWATTIHKIIDADTEHEPRMNPGCGRCPIRVDCKVWIGLPGRGEGLIARQSKRSLKNRVESLQEMKDTKNRLDDLIKEIEAALRVEIQTGDKPFKVKGGEWFLDQGQQREVDWLEVAKLMGDEFVRRAKMTLADLDAWREDHPEINVDHLVRWVPSHVRLKFREPE